MTAASPPRPLSCCPQTGALRSGRRSNSREAVIPKPGGLTGPVDDGEDLRAVALELHRAHAPDAAECGQGARAHVGDLGERGVVGDDVRRHAIRRMRARGASGGAPRAGRRRGPRPWPSARRAERGRGRPPGPQLRPPRHAPRGVWPPAAAREPRGTATGVRDDDDRARNRRARVIPTYSRRRSSAISSSSFAWRIGSRPSSSAGR